VSPLLLAQSEEFTPPTSRDFELPPIFTIAGFEFTKVMLLLLLSVVIVAGLFLLASRRAALVPGKLQFVGESTYGFIRNGVARDVIGGRDFRPFVPYLVTLFCFILVNNLFGIIPLLQFPTMSRFGIPLVLAVISWLVYNAIGVRRHGFGGYLKHSTVPPGVPKAIYPLIIPIEFVSNILTRPLTLSLRLFANMFAGHLLLLVFILGGEHLLEVGGALAIVSPFAFLLAIVLTFFEALVQVLQAYIFTLLSALYVAGAVAEEH